VRHSGKIRPIGCARFTSCTQFIVYRQFSLSSVLFGTEDNTPPHNVTSILPHSVTEQAAAVGLRRRRLIMSQQVKVTQCHLLDALSYATHLPCEPRSAAALTVTMFDGPRPDQPTSAAASGRVCSRRRVGQDRIGLDGRRGGRRRNRQRSRSYRQLGNEIESRRTATRDRDQLSLSVNRRALKRQRASNHLLSPRLPAACYSVYERRPPTDDRNDVNLSVSPPLCLSVSLFLSLPVCVCVSLRLCVFASLQGLRHDFKGGRDNFASGASEKNFFDPPTLRLLGGTKMIMV